MAMFVANTKWEWGKRYCRRGLWEAIAMFKFGCVRVQSITLGECVPQNFTENESFIRKKRSRLRPWVNKIANPCRIRVQYATIDSIYKSYIAIGFTAFIRKFNFPFHVLCTDEELHFKLFLCWTQKRAIVVMPHKFSSAMKTWRLLSNQSITFLTALSQRIESSFEVENILTFHRCQPSQFFERSAKGNCSHYSLNARNDYNNKFQQMKKWFIKL